MTSFSVRAAKHFWAIRATKKAASEFKKEIEKAGLDTLKTLAEKGVSIVGTYLDACSPREKEVYKRYLNTLWQMGVTADILLEEIVRQMPEIAPIMKGKEDYKASEIQALEQFLKEGTS